MLSRPHGIDHLGWTDRGRRSIIISSSESTGCEHSQQVDRASNCLGLLAGTCCWKIWIEPQNIMRLPGPTLKRRSPRSDLADFSSSWRLLAHTPNFDLAQVRGEDILILTLRRLRDSTSCISTMTDNMPPSAEALTNGKAQAAPTDATQETDLLPKLIPYLDRHLIFPLLEFVSGLESEESTEITKTKYELLKQTNMTDYVASLWQELHDSDEVPSEFVKKREEVLQRLQLFSEETNQISELLSDDSVVSNLRSDKVANLKFLETNHGVTIDMVNMLCDYGRFQYSCGSYANAAHLLDQFRILSTDNDKTTSATWGKLACDILTTQWDMVMEEVNKVKESIDTKLFNNPLAQLQHRTWLIHWTLFPFFNYETARDTITDLFFSPAFINTIQTSCPWILRYLAAAVITNRSRTRNTGQYQKQLKDLVRVVRQEGYEYNDPVTDFIKALYLDFDFEEAQRNLAGAEEVLKADFFLSASADAFVEAARHLISESYCKIHQRIDIGDLSRRLGLEMEEGEKWIVNLIRDTRMDGKIDFKEGTVVMNHPPTSVYQQVRPPTSPPSYPLFSIPSSCPSFFPSFHVPLIH